MKSAHALSAIKLIFNYAQIIIIEKIVSYFKNLQILDS